MLADTAQEWTEGCEWAHGMPTWDPAELPYSSMGQNLHFTTGTLVPANAITAWWNEKDHYTIGDNSCEAGEQCGHYKQVTVE